MLTVGGFNRALSTLGNSLTAIHPVDDGMNGMKFSTKDLDQDNRDDRHCASSYTGGWWYNKCGSVHLTGLHTENRTSYGWQHIYYRHGGDRVGELNSFDSWKEARMTLVANVPQLYPINAFSSKNGRQGNQAEKCIDGIKTDPGNMCHTDCDTNAPWLALEFLEPVKVTRVDIYNLGGECGHCAARARNLEVRVTNELPTSEDQMYTEGQILGTFQGPGTIGQLIRMESSAKTGRYVLVQMNHTSCLSFHEVEVFGSVSTDGVTAKPESSPIATTEDKVTSEETFLYVVIAVAAFSGILLLLLIGVIILMYKMWSTARNAIKKDINPLYGVEYEEGVEVKHPSAEAKDRKVDPRSKSVDLPYDYMGS